MNNGNGSNGNGKHSTYQDHVDRSNSQYIAEFDTWWNGLEPEVRRRLENNGINGGVKAIRASLTASCTAELDHDAADTPAASYDHTEEASGWGGVHSVDFAERVDRLSDHLIEKFRLNQQTAHALAMFVTQTIENESVSYKAWLFARVCGEILNAKNVKLTVAGLAFASNLAALNNIGSMRKFGRVIHVSHEAVSKVKRRWQKILELPDSPHSKDPEARAKYSAVQSSDRHWRRQKFNAATFRRLQAADEPTKTAVMMGLAAGPAVSAMIKGETYE